MLFKSNGQVSLLHLGLCEPNVAVMDASCSSGVMDLGCASGEAATVVLILLCGNGSSVRRRPAATHYLNEARPAGQCSLK